MENVRIKLELFEREKYKTHNHDFYFVAEGEGGGLIKLEIAGKKFEFDSEGKLTKGNFG